MIEFYINTYKYLDSFREPIIWLKLNNAVNTSGDKLEEIETRFHAVCKPVSKVFITLHNTYYAGTTADLWMYIRQGDIECNTVRPTWDAPDEEDYYVTYWRNARGCANTFDYTKKVDLWLSSDSNNAVYIRQMGAKIGDVTKKWVSSSYIEVEHDENNGWWTTSS